MYLCCSHLSHWIGQTVSSGKGLRLQKTGLVIREMGLVYNTSWLWVFLRLVWYGHRDHGHLDGLVTSQFFAIDWKVGRGHRNFLFRTWPTLNVYLLLYQLTSILYHEIWLTSAHNMRLLIKTKKVFRITFSISSWFTVIFCVVSCHINCVLLRVRRIIDVECLDLMSEG